MKSCLRLVLVVLLTVVGLVASTPAPADAAHDGSGYWMLTADGHVHGFGAAAPPG